MFLCFFALLAGGSASAGFLFYTGGKTSRFFVLEYCIQLGEKLDCKKKSNFAKHYAPNERTLSGS